MGGRGEGEWAKEEERGLNYQSVKLYLAKDPVI